MLDGDEIFPLGLGTNRFPIVGVNDEAGIEKSVDIVLSALEGGVQYIDTARTYSRGAAFGVLRKAFAQTNRPYRVTVKVQNNQVESAAATRQYVYASLSELGISKATYFVAWSIKSYADFQAVMARDGVYSGALKLKEEGVVDHICCSLHAPTADTIRIIDSGCFELVTISYSLLNATSMQPVLNAAQERKVDVVVMNPLGGGVVPQNRDYFSFVKNRHEQSTVQAALRYLAAHSPVKVILSGISSMLELEENLAAFTCENLEPDEHRVNRVNNALLNLDNFCTGCNYCDGCPSGIPISSLMQSYNVLNFPPVEMYNRTTPNLLQNIQLFRKMTQDFSILFEDTQNPCCDCGLCEKKCTQKLKIIDAVADIYNRARASAFSLAARKKCLDELIHRHGYRKVGFYPAGGYTSTVLQNYVDFFGAPNFQIVLFDSNPVMRGRFLGRVPVYGPGDIVDVEPDCIIVSNYNYNDEIFESLTPFINEKLDIKSLHSNDDVPWVF